MKRLLILFFVLGLVALCAGVAGAQNLLSNGNLDLTYAQEIVPGFFLPKPLVWVNEGSRTIAGPYEDEMSSEPWAGPAPTPETTDGNANGPHPEGCGGADCAVFFKPFSGSVANGAATGHLYQDVAGTPGLRYILSGWAGAEANALMGDAQLAIEFLNGGGTEIGSAELSMLPTLTVDNGLAFDYKLYSVSGVAPAGTATVRSRVSMIDALGNPLGGGQAFVVDDFSLVAVPEPASLALVALAIAGLIGIRRRSN